MQDKMHRVQRFAVLRFTRQGVKSPRIQFHRSHFHSPLKVLLAELKVAQREML